MLIPEGTPLGWVAGWNLGGGNRGLQRLENTLYQLKDLGKRDNIPVIINLQEASIPAGHELFNSLLQNVFPKAKVFPLNQTSQEQGRNEIESSESSVTNAFILHYNYFDNDRIRREHGHTTILWAPNEYGLHVRRAEGILLPYHPKFNWLVIKSNREKQRAALLTLFDMTLPSGEVVTIVNGNSQFDLRAGKQHREMQASFVGKEVERMSQEDTRRRVLRIQENEEIHEPIKLIVIDGNTFALKPRGKRHTQHLENIRNLFGANYQEDTTDFETTHNIIRSIGLFFGESFLSSMEPIIDFIDNKIVSLPFEQSMDHIFHQGTTIIPGEGIQITKPTASDHRPIAKKYYLRR